MTQGTEHLQANQRDARSRGTAETEEPETPPGVEAATQTPADDHLKTLLSYHLAVGTDNCDQASLEPALPPDILELLAADLPKLATKTVGCPPLPLVLTGP